MVHILQIMTLTLATNNNINIRIKNYKSTFSALEIIILRRYYTYLFVQEGETYTNFLYTVLCRHLYKTNFLWNNGLWLPYIFFLSHYTKGNWFLSRNEGRELRTIDPPTQNKIVDLSVLSAIWDKVHTHLPILNFFFLKISIYKALLNYYIF